jgi:pilus assembly protein Flp/PilA
MKVLDRFAKSESGATAIEWGLIVALIALGLIAAATYFGPMFFRPWGHG